MKEKRTLKMEQRKYKREYSRKNQETRQLFGVRGFKVESSKLMGI